MKRSRLHRRALVEEWRQVRRELLGDPEIECDPTADLRTDFRQLRLIVWIAAAAARRRVSNNYSPGDAVSSAWQGVIDGLLATPGKRVAALNLRAQLLQRAKQRIAQDEYLSWRGCGSTNAKAMRAAKVAPAAPLSTLDRGEARRIFDVAAAPAEAQADTADRIAEALRSVPPDCRQVAEMFFLDGMMAGEIAEALGLTVNTVRGRVKRAREAWGLADGKQVDRTMRALPARPCTLCARLDDKIKRGLCHRCYRYRSVHGTDRPLGDDLRSTGADRIREQAKALARAWGARSVA